MKELKEVLQEHAINILQRLDPKNTAYYQIVWKEEPLQNLCTYPMPKVYDDVPELGFLDEYERPDETLNFT